MKLLSVCLTGHDGNISYFDGAQVHYLKLERRSEVKRSAFADLVDCEKHIKELWGVAADDIDAMVFLMPPEYIFNPVPWQDLTRTGLTQHAINLKGGKNPLTQHFPGKEIWYMGHHYAHALSAWMLAEEPSKLSIVIDGLGDGRTWSVFEKGILLDYGDPAHGRIGRHYSGMGKFLGVDAPYLDRASKLMGLLAYSSIDEGFLVRLREYGIRQIDNIFNFAEWESYKGDPLVAKQFALPWAATVSERIGEVILELFHKYASADDLIVYSGGVAQNVVINEKIRREFPNLVIPPHCSDEGLSLGGIEFLRVHFGLPKFSPGEFPFIQEDEAPAADPDEDTIKQVARYLADGKSVGWYQGQGEAGPRALGNRSILLDPRIADGKQKINLIKKRENYRPFGASVLQEHARQVFDMSGDDPFMLFTAKVRSAGFPAITHVDGTCRVQTVTNSNPAFKRLLEEFYQLTGCPVLLNTSLNVAGRPLAGYKKAARTLFEQTPLDCLVTGNEVVCK